jgi:hypothetical protein
MNLKLSRKVTACRIRNRRRAYNDARVHLSPQGAGYSVLIIEDRIMVP